MTLKLITLVSLILNLYFIAFWYWPTGMYEVDYRHQNTITWERDPAFTASMFTLVDDSLWYDTNGLWIGNAEGGTIIADVPQNNYDLMVLGHEFLHSFGYWHE
jgi:hypothetical protein